MAGQAGQFDPQALAAVLSKLGWDHGDLAAAVHDVEEQVTGRSSTLPFSTDTVASWTSGDRRPRVFYGARAWIALEDAARRAGQRLTPEGAGFNHLASKPRFWEEVGHLQEARGEHAERGPSAMVRGVRQGFDPQRGLGITPVAAQNGPGYTTNPDAGYGDFDPEAKTFSLTYSILSPRTDQSVIDTIEACTYRLSRLYAHTQPSDMLSRVQDQLRAVRGVLNRSLHLTDHVRVLTAAGWQFLLLAMLHYDLGQYQAGQASRDAAMYLGREVRNQNLVGWAYETAAWFAIYEGVPQDVVEAATEGRDQSPENSPAKVMNVLKLGVGWARLGRPREAVSAIEEAQDLAGRIPTPAHPDHQFGFDGPKLDLYVARIYALLKMPQEAERHARIVIDRAVAHDPATNAYPLPPTRESFGRLDLASALLDRGELEEACNQAKNAFGSILRHDVLNRAGEIAARLSSVDPSHIAVRDYHERYREACQRLISH